MTDILLERPAAAAARKPRIGFLGVGWIGRSRMEAIVAAGAVDAAAIAEPSDEMAAGALALAPGAERLNDLDALLDNDLDGLVIATPSALHAEQSIRALERGVAVFCQKPLGRSAAEAQAVVDAARRADRLLGVDLSYRFTEGVRRLRDELNSGELGRIHAVDLTFHNAWGPDKPWFYDPALSGGGCVMDLGVHLVDLVLWLLPDARVVEVSSVLQSGGRPLQPGAVEDYAVATLMLDTGCVVRLACSWRLPAGQEAVISAAFYGEGAGAGFRNVGGSFYDFAADRFDGHARRPLATPPDDWGGRAAADWARRLAGGSGFDPEVASTVEVARVLDRIYGRETG